MAELAGLPVPRMDWHSSDAPQAFKKFKALCELYFSGPLEGKSEAEQISYLLIWSGEEGIELVSTWSLSAEEKKKIDTYWTKFESYVSPKSNFRLARYKLRVMKQEKGETVDAFLKRIRVVVNECKFANTDEHIIDALIFGSNSQRVQSKLLEYDETLTLNKAIDIARTEEATTSQLQDIRAEKSINVLRQNNNNKRPIQSKRRQSKDVCGNCGGKHDFSQKSSCPAHGTKCRECGKLNHWRKMCRSGKSKDQQERKNQRGQDMARRPERPVHAIEEKNIEVPAQDTSQLYFHSLFINNIEENRSQAMLKVQVNLGQNTKPLLCKVDTGAEGNVIPVGTYKQLFPKSSYDSSGVPLGLVSSSTRITAFGGQAIEHFGTCKLALSHNDHSGVYSFHVVNTIGPTILGLPTCTDMKLVTLNYSLQHASTGNTNQAGNSEAKANLLTQYADRFEGIGCFKGEYHITLDPTVSPVVHPPRRVPEALRGPLKKELESLESQGIIAKVDEPTDWVNSLVCVTKPNGSIRLCLDPKDLNRAIKRPHHCTPTLDEILPKLNGARYFSIVDARSGYWNIQLDHESSLYTTFNTPHGRYRFLRLPFGLICAQDIFQKKVDETFGDLPGVTGIADDIIVFGFKEDRSDHDSNLKAVMERARETGVKFNPEKCKIGCTELPFFGHIVSASGLKMDPKKTEAIVNMDPSKSLADLQTFLGMTQYLSRFIPNLASFSAHLWDLTKKNSHFIWGPEHQSAVEKIKAKITSPNSLQYFDGSKPVTIQVDASQRGLGATLIQENGPVEYRSKLLTDTEARYSNIEREMLAVVYGLEKFHYYVYGRHVVVETDHKPLEAIFKKHLSTSPPRIARMMLRIQKYDIDIKYVPGKNVPMADALSRLDPCDGDSIEGIDVSIHEFQVHLNASPTRVEQIKKETAKDPELHSLKMFVTQGWPEKRAECPSQLHPYWNYRDELTVFDGMILKGTRVLIPKSLQPEVLNQLHYAHQGAEKCKLRAKGSVFWVNINADLEEMVKGCGPCQHNQKMNVREPLTPHDVPQKPWHTLGSDIFFWNNSSYLLVSDYFSKFPLVRKLSNLESSTTIAHLKGIFEEHGIPATLITGNDTQFTSAAFQEFCHVYGFVHVTTSPYYPQSNGFIERTVQTVKNLFQKCKESGADPHLAMLCLRTTPIDHSIPSPAELLNSRVYQSNLPAISKPQLFSLVDTDIPVKLQERQDRQKLQYDKSSKSLPPLYPMDSARMFNPRSKKWEPAVIQSARETPKSYVVKLSSGSTLIRNRRHIRPTGESFETESQDLPSSLPDLENPGGVTTSTAQDLHKPSSPPKPQQVPKTPPLRRSSRMVKPPERLNL